MTRTNTLTPLGSVVANFMLVVLLTMCGGLIFYFWPPELLDLYSQPIPVQAQEWQQWKDSLHHGKH